MIRILGIDPGSINTGYGIIDSQGNHAKHIGNGVIKISGETLADKLRMIHEGIVNVIHEYQPAEVSIENSTKTENFVLLHLYAVLEEISLYSAYCTLGFDELIFFWIRFEHAGSALSA